MSADASTSTLSPTATIAVDAMPVGTAAFNAARAPLDLVTELQKEANSPDRLRAAAAQKKLAAMDALSLAQKANDIEAERHAVEASGQS